MHQYEPNGQPCEGFKIDVRLGCSDNPNSCKTAKASELCVLGQTYLIALMKHLNVNGMVA